MTDQRDIARQKLADLASQRDSAERLADVRRQKLYAGCLKAFERGLTWKEIAKIAGVSEVRVGQILRDQRDSGSALTRSNGRR